MRGQLPLELRLRHAPQLEDFVVGRNQVVLDALRSALTGEAHPFILLSGAIGSGRTHLLLGQCAAAQRLGLRCTYLPMAEHTQLACSVTDGLESLDLIAVDDVGEAAGHKAWELALFNLFNRCRDTGTRLLFSADRGPTAIPVQLPDLRSRLAWGLTLALQPLDDPAKTDLIKALAARRGLQISTEVARYLLDRSPRNTHDLLRIIEQLDHASLVEKRRLTVPFVRDRLGY